MSSKFVAKRTADEQPETAPAKRALTDASNAKNPVVEDLRRQIADEKKKVSCSLVLLSARFDPRLS